MSWRPGQARSALDGTELDLASWPAAWFGAGAVRRLPEAEDGGAAVRRPCLGLCHAIGHAIGGWFGVPHGEALMLVLPQVLKFNAAVCGDRIADLAFPLGAGRSSRPAAWNAAAAIEAVAALAAGLGLGAVPDGVPLAAADFPRLAADALADEVLANTPRQPSAADITSLLAEACQPRR